MTVITTKRTTLFVVMLVLVILTSGAVAAQDDAPHPFLQLLGAIPDNPGALEDFSYVDFRAIVAGREGAPLVTNGEEWQAMREEDSLESQLWFAAFQAIYSGPSDLMQNIARPFEMRDAIGIDPYTIDRAVTYGLPPSAVAVIQGEFDTDAITAAYTARDYLENERSGFTLWCGNEECDGTRTNLASRNPADPFGGALGRQQPVLIAETLVASSADIERLELQAEALAGEAPTLADNADFRAIAEAITQDGLLRQMWFVNPVNITPDSSAVVGAIAENPESASEVATREAERAENAAPIPPYRLAAFADIATETEQIAVIALAYTDAEFAEGAGEILLDRMENYVSLRTQQPLTQMLEERGVTSIETEIYETDERAVLLILLRGTQVTAEPVDEELSRLASSSMLFRLLPTMYTQRDIGWLAWIP